MNPIKAISRHVKKLSSGKSAVVVIPIGAWKKLLRLMEEYEEVLPNVKEYMDDIAASRRSKKEISLDAMLKKYVVT